MDLFYYGSQDIPPPLGRGTTPRLRGPSASGHCEACNAAVAAGDVGKGRAKIVYGLLLSAGIVLGAA